jgi:hypothetical protein
MPKAADDKQVTTELVEQKNTLPATTNDDGGWEEYAGAGLEGTTADSFSIPFLTILQKGSPQVDETSGAAVQGAKAGMLFETVSGKMYDGKAGVRFVHCAQRRTFLRWRPRGVEGAGFRGEVQPEKVPAMINSGELMEVESRLYFKGDGHFNEKKNDRLADTRNHYILIVNDDDSWTQALLSLTSTQIKKSKMLLALFDQLKGRNAAGKTFKLPTFSRYVRMTTVPESNDAGSWYGAHFELEGPVARDSEIAMAAAEFNKLILSNQVPVKYDDAVNEERSGGGRGEKILDSEDVPF